MLPDVKIDQKIAEWTVIDNNPIKLKTGLYINCRCKCGKEKLVGKSRLLNGKTTICSSCSPKEYKQNLHKGSHKGVGLITKTLFGHYKTNATKIRRNREIEFTVTIEYLWELFLKQEGKCALTGIDLILYVSEVAQKDKKYYSYMTASLDRIDSSYGYIPGNVQWVHKWINIMKNTLDNDQFLYLCNKVTNNNENFEPSLVNIEFLDKLTRKVQRLTGEESITNNPDTSAQHPNKDEDIV